MYQYKHYIFLGLFLLIGLGLAGKFFFPEKKHGLLIEGLESHFSVMGQENAELIIGLLHNKTNDTQRLIKIESSVADHVMIYALTNQNFQGEMQLLDEITLKPESQFSSRGSNHQLIHIVLVGLKKPLVRGEYVPVTFHLSQYDSITKMIKVLDTPESHSHDHHH
jgi:copper(I)-binding protein